jgi:transposase-like protein
MSPFPRIARVPLTVKQPEACPHWGSHVLTRRGTRTKKLGIVQLWRCSSCKRVFTPGPAALRNKTYPLRMILSALTDYDTGHTLQETAGRLKKKTNRSVSPSTIATEPHNHLAEVKYGNGEFVFVVTDNADVLRAGTYTWNALCEETGVDGLKVIGNIYENPELLK